MPMHADREEVICCNSKIRYAEAVRQVLVFLVDQVAASKKASIGFTENMRKLLEKRGKKSS